MLRNVFAFILFSLAASPSAAVTIAVFPTGDADVDRSLQLACEGRSEVETISQGDVREEMNVVTIAGTACATPTPQCLAKLGAALQVAWILVPRRTTDTDVTISLYDLATQLELVKADARVIKKRGKQVTIFDRALGRLFNPQASGSIEVQTEDGVKVQLDDDGATKLGPNALFEGVAPGEHIIAVQSSDGRSERITVVVNGAARTTANIALSERSRPLLLIGTIAASTGLALVATGAVIATAMQVLIFPLYVGTGEERQLYQLVGLGGLGIVGLGAVPLVAGGVMAGVGVLVE